MNNLKNKALAYAQILGWAVFPCHSIVDSKCTCGSVDCKSQGKHPLTINGVKDATTSPQQIIDWWDKYPYANIAVATGKISGIVVIDVDINHDLNKFGDVTLAEIAKDRKKGKLCDDVHALTGGGGLHLVFAYPQGIDKIPSRTGNVGAGIDTRADSGYIICEPSIHISGNTYEWEASSDPFDGIELPQMPTWLIEQVKESDRPINIITNSNGFSYSGTYWDCMGSTERKEFLQALNLLPVESRDDWLKVGMAIHDTNPTEEGFELWCSISMKSTKFDLADQARVWYSFKNNKVEKLTKLSVYKAARDAGWQSEEVKQKEIELTTLAKEIVESENNPLEHDPSEYVDTSIKIDYEFPLDCNLLNQVAGIINGASSCVVNAATTQTTLALASLMASRKYVTPFSDPCHLYLGTVAAGGDASEARESTIILNEILDSCGLYNMVRDTRITSTQILYKMLLQSPACLYICEDLTNMISTSGKQTSAGGLDVVLNTITNKLYSSKKVALDSCQDVGMRKDELNNFRNDSDIDDKPIIIHPSLTMLSVMHSSSLPIFSKSNEIARGSTAQFIVAICDERDYRVKEKGNVVLEDQFIDDLYHVRGFKRDANGRLDKTIKDIFDSLAKLTPSLIKVEFEDSLDEYDKMIDSVVDPDDRYLRNFRTNALKNMRRLMTVLAAFNPAVSVITGKPVATKPIMQWCAQYIAGNLQRFLNELNVIANDDGKMDIEQKVTQVVLNAGSEGITRSRLTDKSRPFRSLSKEKRDELLEKMAGDGILKLNVHVKNFAGQDRNRIVHSTFIKK